MNININDIKNGMTIIIDGKLCLIEEFQHVKPGKGAAFMKMKLRNLRTGSLVEETYNTNIKIVKNMLIDGKELYYGEYDSLRNMKEGRGILITKNGSKYIGYFQNNKKKSCITKW